VSIYDVHADCRHSVPDSTALAARFGHESGFAPDGNTLHAAGTAVNELTAIDVTDPTHPHPIWVGTCSCTASTSPMTATGPISPTRSATTC
jgi:hypothetical protein